MLSIERGKPQEERIKNVSLTGPVQKKITTMTASNMKNMCMKMFRTVYELTMNPTVSLRQFKTSLKFKDRTELSLLKVIILTSLYCMLSDSLIFIYQNSLHEDILYSCERPTSNTISSWCFYLHLCTLSDQSYHSYFLSKALPSGNCRFPRNLKNTFFFFFIETNL